MKLTMHIIRKILTAVRNGHSIRFEIAVIRGRLVVNETSENGDSRTILDEVRNG